MKKLIIGCCCMGCLMANAQNNAIFKGGAGSGGSRGNFVQSSTDLWLGGFGDGFASERFSQNSVTMWLGGEGDGYARNAFSQQSTNLWQGGEGDGHTKNGYTQESMSFWNGGGGDGWASTYIPTRVLPVTLLSFEAEKIAGKYSRLVWKTAKENSNQYFEIERGNDGITFSKIGTVKGAGNTNATTEYTKIDSMPSKGYNYYRLKQVDVDGKFTYSPARLVRFDEVIGNTVRIYPNPATDWITIELSGTTVSENSVINIVSMNGAVVGHIKVAAGSSPLIRFNTARLSKAVYIVHVVSKSNTQTSRILIQ
jgi:hypothetical protein